MVPVLGIGVNSIVGKEEPMAINIGVDVGGTFTDFAVSMPTDGTHLYYKGPIDARKARSSNHSRIGGLIKQSFDRTKWSSEIFPWYDGGYKCPNPTSGWKGCHHHH